MRTYFAVVEKEEGSAFGVRFPDLPGCFSASDNQDDILKNAIQALDLHLEGQVAPKPRGMVDISADPEVAEALAEGAVLIAVPHIESDRRVVRANLSFERGVLRAIDHTAGTRGLTRSSYLADLAMRDIQGA